MTLANQDQRAAPTGGEKAAESRLAGYVDAIVSGRVYGWAWDAAHPDRSVILDLRQGDRVVGSVEASRFREDLLKLGVGNGRHAFEFDLPAEVRDAPATDLKVVFQQNGAELGRNAQLTLVAGEAETADEDEGGPASLRMRRIEEHLTKIINITVSMHGQLIEQRGIVDALRSAAPAAAIERRLDASFLAVNRRLDELAKSVAGAEGFLLRTDERLRELSERSDASTEPALRREIRGVGVILLCAILAVMTMLLA